MNSQLNTVPKPHSSVAGVSSTDPKGSAEISRRSQLWMPKNASGEKVANLARFAHRLIDRVTGKAYSADELADGGLAEASSITHGLVAVAAATLAIPITHRYVRKTTGAGAEALTLANGAFIGQRLNIRLVVDGGGAGTLTPTTKNGFVTVVLDDAGEFVDLEWTSDGWIIVGLGGLTAQPTVTV